MNNFLHDEGGEGGTLMNTPCNTLLLTGAKCELQGS